MSEPWWFNGQWDGVKDLVVIVVVSAAIAVAARIARRRHR